MKLLAASLFTLVAAVGLRQHVSAISTDATIKILPLHCKFEIIDDGTNEIRYITPGACGIKLDDDTPQANETEPFPVWQYVQSPESEGAARKVLLNNLTGFIGSNGLTIEMLPNQVVHFAAHDNSLHSVTLNTIGKDFVILTVASKPIDATIYVGETKLFDPTRDNINDIEITLKRVSSSAAELNFRQLPNEPLESSGRQADFATILNNAASWRDNWLVTVGFVAVIMVATVIIIRLLLGNPR
jgi:hypothetical protein